MVEVTQIQRENNLEVTQDGASTRLLKLGLYDFDADNQTVRVFDGEAMVTEGSRRVKVKAGHEVSVAGDGVSKATSFDKKAFESDALYRWSSLRSAYLAEANADVAPSYEYGGAGLIQASRYWDPWFDAYTFIPGDGIFYSPFGWGFYSPFYAGWGPFGWGYGGRILRPFPPPLGNNYRAWGPGAHSRPRRSRRRILCRSRSDRRRRSRLSWREFWRLSRRWRFPGGRRVPWWRSRRLPRWWWFRRRPRPVITVNRDV